MKSRRLVALTVLLPALLLSACGPCVRPAASSAPAPAWTATHLRTELYFGLSKPGGGTVTEAEWQDFLDRELTPRFRDGLTVLDGRGQWLESSGRLAREPSKVAILIHADTPAARKAADEAVAAYKKRFQQESVLKVTTPVRAEF